MVVRVFRACWNHGCWSRASLSVRILFLLVALLGCSAVVHAKPLPILPDRAITPGTINPNVTQGNISKTVCNPGWPEKYRHVTLSEKKRVSRLYGFLFRNIHRKVEFDHVVPITAGGANSPKNLMPESHVGKWGSLEKDKLEWKIHRLLCKGKITLKQDRAIWLGDWRKADMKYRPNKAPKTLTE